MKIWENKVAIITDCNDEVGINIIEQLSKAGMLVIGFAKTDAIVKHITEKLENTTGNKISGNIVLYKCNITDVHCLENVFKKIIETYKGVDVLINNAYCNLDCHISDGDLERFRRIIDVNIFALVACTRLAAGSMIERQTRGHIININDLCAYQIPEESKKNIFIATKATITSINEILRHEFRYLKANIKVTNIACGNVECFEEPNSKEPALKIKDVARLVKLILNTPEHLQVHEILLDSTLI